MTERTEFVEFVWLPTFEQSAKGLLNEEDRRELEIALVEHPDRGELIPRTGGFRKLRWAAGGKGRSGGARVVYFHVAHRETIYMILAYGKGVKEDLTESERKELKKLAVIIKRGKQ